MTAIQRILGSPFGSPITALAGGALVYGLIAAQSLVICADHGCQSAFLPGLAMPALALIVAITLSAQLARDSTAAADGSARWQWAIAALCFVLALACALVAVLWVGFLVGAAFADFVNPWYRVPFLSPAANLFACGGMGCSGRIYWLGWPVGGGIELVLDAMSSVAITVGALLVLAGLRRAPHSPAPRSNAARWILVVSAMAIVLDLVVTVPAEAHDAAGFRAAHYLGASRTTMLSETNAVLQRANVADAGDAVQRAKDVGQGYAGALGSFTDRLTTITFPDWAAGQLSTEKTNLTNSIIAATSLTTAANGSDLAIQDAYQRLDDALQRENLSERALYLALYPQAYLKGFLRT